MTVLAAPSVRLLTKAVADRLDTIDGLTVYPGGLGSAKPPILQIDGAPDPDGRVAQYAAVYPSPGRASRQSMAPQPDAPAPDLDWTVQVTVAAGYHDLALAAVDDVRAVLGGWAPAIDGHVIGALQQLNDPGPIRPDESVKPIRWYSPLIYGLEATTL